MQMDWDFEDQLQQVDLGGGGTAYYVYDAGGQRVRKVIERRTARARRRTHLSRRLRDLPRIQRQRRGRDAGARDAARHGRQAAHRAGRDEDDENGTPINAPAPLIATSSATISARPAWSWTTSGGLISYEEYHPYGSTSYQAVSSAAEVSLKRYRYTGKERDEETGLYYHGARYYAPWLGRWATPDPSGLNDGVNLYACCSGNPLKFSDLDGRAGRNPTPRKSKH